MFKVVFVFFCAISNQLAMADGPIGIGAIQIGMTKSEIESLPESEPIRLLSGQMSPFISRHSKPTEGLERYQTLLVQPFVKDSLETFLEFQDSKLALIHIRFRKENERALNEINLNISEKYGKPIIKDTKKEEQCVYGNGANFKIINGGLTHSWFEENKMPGITIETKVSNITLQSCPSSLRFSIPPSHLLNLTISVTKKSEKVPNPF